MKDVSEPQPGPSSASGGAAEDEDDDDGEDGEEDVDARDLIGGGAAAKTLHFNCPNGRPDFFCSVSANLPVS